MAQRILFFIILFFGLMSASVEAQRFGGNPTSIKWKQIDTDTARLIFPSGIEPTAERVAQVIHQLQSEHTTGIGNRLKKVNIVLQNQNTLPNGYVGLGPWRSEFYLFAPQNVFEQGSINWPEKLAIHEYRHIQQFNNFNVGVAKAARILFGQQGQAVINSAAIPDYFFEGDAVFNETILTRQGRGRQPLFFSGYKALYNEGKTYSYQKLRNGSLKDFVPNHYELGYLLVAYGRQKFGSDFWRAVTQDAARFKPLVYPWQGSIKKHTGLAYNQFVQEAFEYFQSQWKVEASPPGQFLTAQQRVNTDYTYPASSQDGSIITLKKGYRQIPAFYKILLDGREEEIATRGIAYDDYFSYKNGRITYSVLQPDLRWSYREYNDIYLLDVETKKSKRITTKERFVSPDLSHNGLKIAVVEMRAQQQSNLTIIDSLGNRLWRNNGEPGIVFSYPKFSAGDTMLYTAVRNYRGMMALRRININNSKVVDIVPFGDRAIGFPVVHGDTVFFTSTHNQQDELWAYIERKNQVVRVARALGGLYHPAVGMGGIVAANFTAQGFRLAIIKKDAQLWEPMPLVAGVADLYVPNALQKQKKLKLDTSLNRDFEIKKYHKAFQLFNFHSWRPGYDQAEFSYTFYGQNILNTFQSEVAYTYNRNERSNKIGVNFIYGGWYLQPSFGGDQTFNRRIILNRDTTFNYNERRANVGLSLPLILSDQKHFRNLNLTSSIHHNRLTLTGLGRKFFKDQNFFYLQNRITYVSQVQKAAQQIYPRWAQSFVVQYRTVLNNYKANQFYATGSIFLPALHTNHSIVLNLAISSRDTMNQYYFSNSFSFSRGYTSIDFPRMFRLGVNYHFPLLYPDKGLANIVYFRRVRANLFYDYTRTVSLKNKVSYQFQTVGTELFFDTKWWNQQLVTFGVRYSRLLNSEFRGITRSNQWEVILPINLFD